MVAELWNRSVSVVEALRYVSYLYLVYGNIILMNTVMYTEHRNLEKWFMYKLQVSKLLSVFESLPDFFTATVETLNQRLRLELS